MSRRGWLIGVVCVIGLIFGIIQYYQVKGMPVVAVSGMMGEGIDRLMSSIEEAYAVWNRRVSTTRT